MDTTFGPNTLNRKFLGFISMLFTTIKGNKIGNIVGKNAQF